MGFPLLLIREISNFRERGEFGKINFLLRFSSRTVLLFSVALSTVAYLTACFIYNQIGRPILADSLIIVFFTVPLFALIQVSCAKLRAFDRIIPGAFLEKLLFPALYLISLLPFLIWLPFERTARNVLLLQPALLMIVLIVSIVFVSSVRKKVVKTETVTSFDKAALIKGAYSLLFVLGISVVLSRIDVILVGGFLGPELAGRYNIISRVADFMEFAPLAMRMAITPEISRLFAKGETGQVQKRITSAIFLSTAASVAILFCIVFAGQFLLGLLGEEFIPDFWPLVFLTGGKFLASLFGSGALLLILTNREKLTRISFVIGVITNVILNAVLIPVFGIYGEVARTIAASIVMRFYAWLKAWNLVGIINDLFSGYFQYQAYRDEFGVMKMIESSFQFKCFMQDLKRSEQHSQKSGPAFFYRDQCDFASINFCLICRSNQENLIAIFCKTTTFLKIYSGIIVRMH